MSVVVEDRESPRLSGTASVDGRRYYAIGGITLAVTADLPMDERTFGGKFRCFEVARPGDDTVLIRHRFAMPRMDRLRLGREVYRRPPWAIYSEAGTWAYLRISARREDPRVHQVALFNAGHTRGKIYTPWPSGFLRGGLHALTLMSTDQILLARLLADRQGCILHSAAAILEGKGFLFAGHSGAGKSTTANMLAGNAEILCDDRNIVRRWPSGFRVYGTWSHGDVPSVSAASAPLRAILFLRQASENRLVRLVECREILGRLLGCLVRPLVTADWWEKNLSLVGTMAREIPCYEMQFDGTGQIVPHLERLAREEAKSADV